jgi:hypothetical protein
MNQGHREGVQSQVLLKSPRLPLIRLRPRQQLDRAPTATAARQAPRGVLDDDRMPGARQVHPAARSLLLVADAANRQAFRAARRETARQNEDDAGVRRHVIALHRLEPRATPRLPVMLGNNPSSKSDNLCENLRALARPGKLPGWSYKPREPPQFRGVDEPALLRHHAAILEETLPPLPTKSGNNEPTTDTINVSLSRPMSYATYAGHVATCTKACAGEALCESRKRPLLRIGRGPRARFRNVALPNARRGWRLHQLCSIPTQTRLLNAPA